MFGLPAMLWWATAAAVPILIHLFARQRFRRVQWAAMEFLKRAFQKTKRRIRIENLLLLLLRVAALVLLALALADPRVRSSILSAGGDSRREVFVVFDTSFSMGYREASGETPFRRAHDQALKLVRTLRSERGDSVTLITAGKPAALRLSRAADLDRVSAEIDRIEIEDSATDLPGAFRTVLSLLEGLPQGAEVFLLTDIQKVAIVPPDDETAPGPGPASRPGGAETGKPSQILATLLDQIRMRGARVSIVPAGVGEADNLAVAEIRLASKIAAINQPVRFSATVRNFGQRPASGVLNLFVDGTEAGVESQAIDLLGPGGTHAADFQHTFREAGAHEVDVRFTTDALEIDNRRALSTLVENRLGVLVVDGSPNPDPGEEASYFVRTALELGGTQTRPPVFQVKTVNDVAFDQQNLAEFDLVVLTNVATVSERRAQELEDFVARGGGLLIFLGSRTAPVRLNELLHKGGAGVLPAAIGTAVGEVNTREPAFEIKPLVIDRPPFSYFGDERIASALFGVPIYRFFSVTGQDAEDTRILAQFGSHKAAVTAPYPAVLEKPFGRGRTILVTSSADREWNELAVFPTYVPFIREMAYHLVRRSERFENLIVGDSYRRDLDRFVKEVILERGGKQLEIIKPTPRAAGQGFEIRVDGATKLNHAGVYRLNYVDPPESTEKPLRPTFIAVNVDPRESDLTRIRPDALGGLFTPEQLRVVESVDPEGRANAAPDENAWWWIAILVLIVLVGESVLAQLFGRVGRGGTS